jgi:hypothetical protein
MSRSTTHTQDAQGRLSHANDLITREKSDPPEPNLSASPSTFPIHDREHSTLHRSQGLDTESPNTRFRRGTEQSSSSRDECLRSKAWRYDLAIENRSIIQSIPGRGSNRLVGNGDDRQIPFNFNVAISYPTLSAILCQISKTRQ